MRAADRHDGPTGSPIPIQQAISRLSAGNRIGAAGVRKQEGADTHQLQERALTAAAAADKGGDGSSLNLQVEVSENDLLLAAWVREGHVAARYDTKQHKRMASVENSGSGGCASANSVEK